MSQSTAEVKYKLQHRNINNGKKFTSMFLSERNKMFLSERNKMFLSERNKK